MNEGLGIVILAAGKGKRMKGTVPKVMETLNGKPMIRFVLDTSKKTNPDKTVVIAGYKKELVIDYLRDDYFKNDAVEIAFQEEQLGTGHAVRQTVGNFENFSGNVFVLAGDVPLLTKKTLNAMQELHKSENAAATILSAELEVPDGYGRIIRDSSGNVTGIVEHKDATGDQLKINEINSSIYLFKSSELFDNLDKINNNNAQGEYYLTDIIFLLQEKGKKVCAYKAPDPDEIRGINTQEQLQYLENLLRDNPGWFD